MNITRIIIPLFILSGLYYGAGAASTDSTAYDFTVLDSLVMHAPPEISRDTTVIAANLLKLCKNDMEKARAAFTWVASNIKYDDNAYNSGKIGNMEPAAVLRTRHAVCEGYSNLYRAICTAMGLEAVRIDGYAKAYGYRPGQKFVGNHPNHVWNAVKIDGNWLLVDATWGAGEAEGERGKLVSRKKFTPYWFNVNKYEFLFKHFPDNTEWLLIPDAVTLKQYQDEIPLAPEGMFMLGFDAHDLLDKALTKSLPKQLPQAFLTAHRVKLIDFPLNGVLTPGASTTFTITSDEDLSFAISNDLKKPPVLMDKSGNTYTATLPLKSGDLHIAIKGKTNYSDILLYRVK
jgi:hypothetical protein